MEWTLGYKNPDSRGNRRYFTIASSPTENELRIGIKFYPNPSSFKNKMLLMREGDKILAGQLSGDFTLPRKSNNELIFIAGGIGITPFRSMIKYLIDNNIKMPITIFYANKTIDEIVYKDVFDDAEKNLGIKTIYSLTDVENIPTEWKGERGRITEEIIKKYAPKYKNSYFYLSGPHEMIIHFEETLYKIGIRINRIRKDFFPGYA